MFKNQQWNGDYSGKSQWREISWNHPLWTTEGKKNIEKNEQNPGYLQDSSKDDIHAIRALEKEAKECGTEKQLKKLWMKTLQIW